MTAGSSLTVVLYEVGIGLFAQACWISKCVSFSHHRLCYFGLLRFSIPSCYLHCPSLRLFKIRVCWPQELYSSLFSLSLSSYYLYPWYPIDLLIPFITRLCPRGLTLNHNTHCPNSLCSYSCTDDREMAQWLRSFTALAEDPDSISWTYMITHNSL